MRGRKLWAAVALLFVCSNIRAHAGATLFLEEPFRHDGNFAGTGHVAIYLDRVCADSPVVLRPCGPGEQGVVLSRYHGIAGYDWLAIPLIPYLYAVDSPEKVPLYADDKLEAFLRERYRQKYLRAVAPDANHGEPPDGPWVQLVGAAYDRTIYGFRIETSREKDKELIRILNSRPNTSAYKLLSNNCADFVRRIVNFYYPRALHRSVIADLGVTTPKQIAKCLVRFSKHHRQMQLVNFVIPQVPGSIKRSKHVKGVIESAFKAKKYMVPLLIWHPAIVGGFAAAYFAGGRFDPGRHALVFTPDRDVEAPINPQQRSEYQSRLNVLRAKAESTYAAQQPKWPRLEAATEPHLDEADRPMLRLHVGDNLVDVGLSRGNILGSADSADLARQILVARLHEALRQSTPTATATDTSSDLQLLEVLQSAQEERQHSSGDGDAMGFDASASQLR